MSDGNDSSRAAPAGGTPSSGRISLDSRLSLDPGVRIVSLGERGLAVSSQILRMRLKGASAEVFLERVLNRLDGRASLREVLSGWSDDARAEAMTLLDRLADAGAVHEGADRGPGPAKAMLGALGLGAQASAHLRDLRVGIVGLEGPGAHVAALLAAQGVGGFTVIDPFECTEHDLQLWPVAPTGAVGRARQDSALDFVGSADVHAPLLGRFTREDLSAALAGCDIVVHTFDRGFSASALWSNSFALAEQRPAVFGQVEGHRAVAGPMVFPGEGPCYLCARMRTLGCVDDFEFEMAVEEELDRGRMPGLAGQASFPALSAWLGSVLALEVTKAMLGVGRPALVGHVRVYDALESRAEDHAVLHNPLCPACRKKGRRPGTPRPQGDPGSAAAGLVGLRDMLVSPRTGIIRALNAIPRDTTEPAWPIVVRAELSNHRFLGPDDEPFEVCSGKGVTVAQAITSALGEGCERYAGARVDPGRITRSAPRYLLGAALGVEDLVPFADDQYRQLRYAVWSQDTPLDWIEGRDMGSGAPVAVPAIAALMHYSVHSGPEFLFPITSNGLAAGSSADAAVAAAALEVIERDAFVIGWMQRLPALRVPFAEIADPTVRRLGAAYERRGVALELYRLATDAPAAVVAAIAVDRVGRPAVVVGLGCDPEPVVACRKAALEIGQVRPALKARLRDPETVARLAELVAHPGRVADIEDHDLLYSHESMTQRLDFWRDCPTTTAALAGGLAAPSVLEHLVAGLSAIGRRLIAVDLTAPELEALGIHAARALIPGFQPIHFGAAEARLGGTRMYCLPDQLGLPTLSRSPAGLNPDPHPLA